MNDPWMVAATLAAALIGGAITAGTAWFLERQRLTVQEGRQRELFVTAILDDLQHSLSLYDRLIEDYEKSHVIWFSTLGELEQSRAFYAQFASHLLLLNDVDLRKRIFRYYLKRNELFGLLRLHQQPIHHYQLKHSELVADIGVRHQGL